MHFGNVITITQLCAFYRVHKVQLYKTNIQVLKLCQIDFVSILFVNCAGKIWDVFEIRNTDFLRCKARQGDGVYNMYVRK